MNANERLRDWCEKNPYMAADRIEELTAKLQKPENAPSAEAVRLARESIATCADAEPSKALLLKVGMTTIAELVDENLLLSREILRLAGISATGREPK